ncbi:hypothetical protein NPM06_30960, partial [Bacillus cereus]|uniref:hypothetical protein n=1 Tax=Bacillus cereus TaxID=1396 RepID=UPI0021117CC8|nr:hypothetical protein [Bacillus cereus]
MYHLLSFSVDCIYLKKFGGSFIASFLNFSSSSRSRGDNLSSRGIPHRHQAKEKKIPPNRIKLGYLLFIYL